MYSTGRYKCRGRQAKVRPGTGRETGLGHAVNDQDERIYEIKPLS